MATTSGNLVAGTVTSQGGNGNNGRYGLKAKVAAGVALLGLAATLAFGGAQLGNRAQSRPQAPQSATSVVDWEQAERAQVAPAQPMVVLDGEQRERTQVAPTPFGPQEYLPGEAPESGGTVPSPAFGPQP